MRILPNASLLYFWVVINNENNYQCQRGCGLNYAETPKVITLFQCCLDLEFVLVLSLTSNLVLKYQFTSLHLLLLLLRLERWKQLVFHFQC